MSCFEGGLPDACAHIGYASLMAACRARTACSLIDFIKSRSIFLPHLVLRWQALPLSPASPLLATIPAANLAVRNRSPAVASVGMVLLRFDPAESPPVPPAFAFARFPPPPLPFTMHFHRDMVRSTYVSYIIRFFCEDSQPFTKNINFRNSKSSPHRRPSTL